MNNLAPKNSILALLAVLTILATNVSSATRELVKGKDYEQMRPKGTVKPEILEFFNYACGACYRLEGFVDNFKKNNSTIKFTVVPVELNPAWKLYVKAYYLGELLQLLNKSHSAMFHRIHVEKKPIKNDQDLKGFFVGLGADPLKFDKANKSFALNANIRKAKQLARKFKIVGTPNFVANRQYKLNNQALGTSEMIDFALKKLTQVQ